jgi:citrate lyase subunit beta/citryl-CoA lyase
MRSLLFAPANNRKFTATLGSRGADAVVLDLEDAVPPSSKDAARRPARVAAAACAKEAPGVEVYVRVNPVPSPWFSEDLSEALSPDITGVVVPKFEGRGQLAEVRARLADHGLAHLKIVLGVETAAGVQSIETSLDGEVRAVYFGAEDFIADLGGTRSAEGLEVLYARSRVALAARCAGVHAIDQAFLGVRDTDGFLLDARAGRAMGYRGKICIHPDQVDAAHTAFMPSPSELDRAQRLLSASAVAAGSGSGVLEFEGHMIDEPALKMARATVQAALGGDA